MIIAVTKIEFYNALLKESIYSENYELSAKLRDTINTIDNPDELFIINTDEDEPQD